MKVALRKAMPVVGLLSAVCILVLVSFVGAPAQKDKAPSPKIIPVDITVTEYKKLLGGPPETVTMHSGLVTLESGKSVGTHNTENYEEVLIVLEGAGKMVITNGPELSLEVNQMAYCPPRTEHNVWNTGKGLLRYIYIVANAEW
jgi:mannose-6-phosphate isomerase-like protein (cupin superfamily)